MNEIKKEKDNNDIQKEIIANIESKKEPFFFTKWALVAWALLWRTVLLPYLGLYAFYMVVIYSFALLGIKNIVVPKFFGNNLLYIYFISGFFMFEWTANVISEKYYKFQNISYLGWALLWRYTAVVAMLILSSEYMLIIRQLFQVTGMSDLALLITSSLIFSLWSMLFFRNIKKKTIRILKNSNPEDTPKSLFNKAKKYVPGLYILFALVVGLSFTIGAGIIILMLMMPRYFPVIVICIGVGVLVTLGAIILAIVKIIFPKAINVLAIKIELKKYPKFQSFLSEIAKATKIKMPRYMVIDSHDEFSVQKNKIKTLNTKVLSGRILTISMPLMRFLTVSELKGIIAHEFGHFSGKDEEFSNKIQPVYSGAIKAIETLTKTSGWMALPNLLPMLILNHYLEGFHKINMRISRGREFRSDHIAAKLVGKDVFIKALKKIYILSPVFYKLLYETDENDETFKFTTNNYYKEFTDLYSSNISIIEKAKAEAKDALEKETGNDFDSHPTVALREKNISSLDNIEEDQQPAICLFDNYEELETELMKKVEEIRKSVELRAKTRYKIILSDLKTMRKDKKFAATLAKYIDMSDEEILVFCEEKKSPNDILSINNLKENEAVVAAEVLKEFWEKDGMSLKVEVDKNLGGYMGDVVK